MPQTLPGAVEQRRAALAHGLESARRELAEICASLDRYEKQIETPRLLAEIQRLELEIRDIDEA
jgi:hypothetical protein